MFLELHLILLGLPLPFLELDLLLLGLPMMSSLPLGLMLMSILLLVRVTITCL